MSRQNYWICPTCGQTHDVAPSGGQATYTAAELESSKEDGIAEGSGILQAELMRVREAAEIRGAEKMRKQIIRRRVIFVTLDGESKPTEMLELKGVVNLDPASIVKGE